MFKRLFPHLANMDGGKLLGWVTTMIFVWVSIAGASESYFIDRGWIKVTWNEWHGH